MNLRRTLPAAASCGHPKTLPRATRIQVVLPMRVLTTSISILLCCCISACRKSTSVSEIKNAPRPPLIVSVQPTESEKQSHQESLSEFAKLAEQSRQTNRYYGQEPVETFRSLKASDKLTTDPLKLLQFATQSGMQELKLGNELEAIQSLLQGYEQAKHLYAQQAITLSTFKNVIFRVGLAYLRLGETENCCQQHNPDSCLLPIQGGGLHTEQEGSRKAIEYFMKMLSLSKSDHFEKLDYEAIWLLNIANMTIGEHPHGVPEPYRIPDNAFTRDNRFPRFPNSAAELGIDSFTMSGGAVADDFNRDGRIDLMVGSWDLRDHVKLYLNQGANKFVDVSKEANLVGIPGGLNLLQADYNNDGHIDVLVLRGAWLFEKGRHPNSLLRNNGDGTFTDVTRVAGIAEPRFPTQAAAWSDFDLDGDLDLYIGNEPVDGKPSPGQLFKNEGDGTFTDVAFDAGIENLAFAKAVVWGDVDNDRYPDLFISNLGGENRLFHNQGDGTFVDIAEAAGLGGFERSFPAFFWDFNNDEKLDLYVSSYSASTGAIAQTLMGQDVRESLSRLYQGDGTSGFRDVTAASGLDEPTFAMGINFGDLDNDGYLDFYLGTGDIDFRHLVPNKMYRNELGKRFIDVSYEGGFSHLQKGHAIVFADFDNDGDHDVFEQMGGAYFGDRYPDAFYRNPGFDRNWLQIDFVGVESNRSAIGTRITATFRENGIRRTVHRRVNSGGSFGANPLRQLIGLGHAKRVDLLTVHWPKTDQIQVFSNIDSNVIIEITEGAQRHRVVYEN